jgi:hypothetical protein
MIKNFARGPIPGDRRVTALGWIVAVIFVGSVVIWHDYTFGSYWDDGYRAGTLFLTQPRHSGRKVSAPEPTTRYPIWIMIMRSEANISIALVAASLVGVGRPLASSAARGHAWREPGTIACLVAVAAMCFCVLEKNSGDLKALAWVWRWGGHPYIDPFPNVWPLCEIRIGVTVLGAWVVMAATGRWKPRRTWADRLGRIVGGLWLAVIVYRVVASLFIPFGNWRY